jgi:hypothetical protein
MSKLPCYHVTTSQGETYGVAATSVLDAMTLTQSRLTGEDSTDKPVAAKRVAMWNADYGTVLHY